MASTVYISSQEHHTSLVAGDEDYTQQLKQVKCYYLFGNYAMALCLLDYLEGVVNHVCHINNVQKLYRAMLYLLPDIDLEHSRLQGERLLEAIKTTAPKDSSEGVIASTYISLMSYYKGLPSTIGQCDRILTLMPQMQRMPYGLIVRMIKAFCAYYGGCGVEIDTAKSIKELKDLETCAALPQPYLLAIKLHLAVHYFESSADFKTQVLARLTSMARFDSLTSFELARIYYWLGRCTVKEGISLPMNSIDYFLKAVGYFSEALAFLDDGPVKANLLNEQALTLFYVGKFYHGISPELARRYFNLALSSQRLNDEYKGQITALMEGDVEAESPNPITLSPAVTLSQSPAMASSSNEAQGAEPVVSPSVILPSRSPGVAIEDIAKLTSESVLGALVPQLQGMATSMAMQDRLIKTQEARLGDIEAQVEDCTRGLERVYGEINTYGQVHRKAFATLESLTG